LGSVLAMRASFTPRFQLLFSCLESLSIRVPPMARLLRKVTESWPRKA